MYVIEASDRAMFRANLPQGVPIRVVRMATTQLVRRPNLGVTMVPAIELTYSFTRGDQQWVFREICTADVNDRSGRVDLSLTLWAELERNDAPYELIQRSGSF